MSHSVVGVLVTEEELKNLDGVIQEKLATYNENLKVDEYEEDCWCVGRIAKNEANAEADKACGSFDSLRESFNKSIRTEIPPKAEDMNDEDYYNNVYEPIEKENNKKWRAHIANRVKAEANALEKHELKNDPDAKCEECEGTGKVMSTYNPKSKWDWYQIGGRWAEIFAEVMNEQIEALSNNPEGMVANEKMQKASDANSENCDPSWAFKHEGKVPTEACIAPVELIIGKDELVPFAILTTDDEWIERGEMGWWGMVKDEKDGDNWKEEVKTIFEKHKDHYIVAVDVHI